MTPNEMEYLPLKLEKQYQKMGEYVMKDICRRIKKSGEITSTADWQINRLVGMGASTEDIEREIKRRLNLSYAEMYEMYDKVIEWEYVRDKSLYEQVNSNFIPYDQNLEMQQIVHSIQEQTKQELENISQSMGFTVDVGGKKVFTPMAQYYQQYVDEACMEVINGVTDYNTAIRKTVRQMADSGMRVGGVTYASGHSDLIDVAARRAVMTGISQLTGHIAQTNAAKLGTNFYEVSWHPGARNTGDGFYNHQSWQGKVYSYEELQSICGLGEGGGLNGWNCYHDYYPFIKGISERQWTDKELDRLNAAENTKKEWNGKEYTTYELTQKQRQMERNMRAQREYIQGLKWGAADKNDILLAQAKYKQQMYVYKVFSDKFEMQPQMQRVYYDMRGRQA